MRDDAAVRLRSLVHLPLLLAGLYALWQFLQVSLQRIGYPYELEWMEGAMLQQVWQLAHGLPIYGRPDFDFVPAIYMPLYYYASELATRWLGLNFLALRTVSMLATAVLLSAVYRAAWRLSGSQGGGIAAVLVMLSTYRYSGYWFDLARVDAMWTALLAVTAAWLLAWRDRPALPVLAAAALFYTLAVFTKQSSLFMLPCLLPYLGLLGGVRAIGSFTAILLSASAVLFLLLSAHGNESMGFYTLRMASSHGTNLLGMVEFTTQDTLLTVPAFFAVAVVGCRLCGRDGRDRQALYWLLAAFALASWVSRSTPGGYFNVRMPYACGLALFAGAGLACMHRLWLQEQLSYRHLSLFSLLMTVNITLGYFAIDRQLPSADNRAAGDRLLARIREIPGEVCVPSHGYLGFLAGKHFCAHSTQIWDVYHGSSAQLAALLQSDIRNRAVQGYYSAFLLDTRYSLHELGLKPAEIPYSKTALGDEWQAFRPVVSGSNPRWLLSYKTGITSGAAPDTGN